MTEPATVAEGSAYDLLSRKTLELTDAEVLVIVEDLRKRRKAYVESGKKDAPKKAASSAPKSKEEQAQLKKDLLASMNLDFD